MSDNIHNISEHPFARSPSALQPATPELATALLSSCLALVRPVGMGEQETAEWLGVAAGAVAHLPAAILDRASLEARRTCTHHSQIVPTIIREAEALLEQRRRIDRHPIVQPASVQRLPVPKLTEEELQYLPEQLRKIGLGAGWLKQDDDGSLRWAETDTAA